MPFRIVLILWCCLIVPVEGQADRLIYGPMSRAGYDVYRPKTREEIYASYHALVEKRDGITKLEARIIAQYEAVRKDLDHGYDTSKPKIIDETQTHFVIRFPSKFSINARKRPPDMLATIDKAKGSAVFQEQTIDQ